MKLTRVRNTFAGVTFAALGAVALPAQCDPPLPAPKSAAEWEAEMRGEVALPAVELVSYSRPRWGCYFTGGTLVRTPNGYVCSWGAGGSFR